MQDAGIAFNGGVSCLLTLPNWPVIDTSYSRQCIVAFWTSFPFFIEDRTRNEATYLSRSQNIEPNYIKMPNSYEG